MREILFKGQRLDNKEWVEGYLVVCSGSVNAGRAYICPSVESVYFNLEGFDVGSFIEVDPETVGQFTGLTDKNGVKVFEGDILLQKTTPKFKKVNPSEWERKRVVQFGYCDFRNGWAGYSTYGFYLSDANQQVFRGGIGAIESDNLAGYYPYEIIGNLWDNPELLEGKENVS